MAGTAGATSRVRSHIESEFWRESEQRWVRHVNMIFWGPNKDEPKRWRHRTVTETVTVTEWKEGER